MSDEITIGTQIAGVFRSIAETRMDGVPILNPELSVEVVGLQEWKEQWFCVLITPWFMNMLLLPMKADDTAWQTLRTGETVRQVLPSGSFPFIVGEEEGLGTYQSCSLFSPMFEFTAQDQAVETARAAIAEVMKSEAAAEENARPLETPAERQELESPARRKLFGMARDAVSGDGA